MQLPANYVSKQTLELPALLRLIPKFPLFPATVDDKALENSSQEPEAQSSLILSLIREPFLKLKHTNTPYAFFKSFDYFLSKLLFYLIQPFVVSAEYSQASRYNHLFIMKETQRKETK